MQVNTYKPTRKDQRQLSSDIWQADWAIWQTKIDLINQKNNSLSKHNADNFTQQNKVSVNKDLKLDPT